MKILYFIIKIQLIFDVGGDLLALDKLCDVYTFDTSAFYIQSEILIESKINKATQMLKKLKNKYKLGNCNVKYYKRHNKILNDIISKFKSDLKNEFNNNINIIRVVRTDYLTSKNIVAIFDSNLTRKLDMCFDRLNLELIIIRVYYFDIMKSIINNGFLLNNERYVFFSSSAGQIRQKKIVVIKEASLKACYSSLTCGLDKNKINQLGGINTNKYLAYLALCNSATDIWENFDIQKCIVVEDMETLVNGDVDFIDENFSITRKHMSIPINHTDGCGMINYGDKNFMIRGPWIKGLLSPFPFHQFIKKHNCSAIVEDIYGHKYDIIKDDIQIILTKSQFKMYKYYKNWTEYKNNFIKYKCVFGICNQENKFNNSVLSYQMLQSLTDICEEEIQYVCKSTKNKIHKLSHDIETMLKVFGANKNNVNKNNFQQCLEIYPELLRDVYTKNTLKAIKDSLEKQAWSGKLDIYGKYTFIVPDLYAFCQFLFLELKEPKGLLEDGEVYCKLFKSCEKLDCLRSPHLYREHAIKNNIAKYKKNLSEWFITSGLYISSHDLISRLLQCDFDGDMSLVVGDKKFVEIAERNMQNVVPLYYEMHKASAREINNNNIYNGMVTAFVKGNIGMPSNEITKIWNNDNIDLDIIKIQCALVNYTIDSAKTLYNPEIPKNIHDKLKLYSKNKLPYFFIYAKNKMETQVEPPTNSFVNKIPKYILKCKLTFKNKELNNFNYKMLIYDNFVDIEKYSCYNIVIDKYKQLTKNVNLYMKQDEKDFEKNNYHYIFRNIKDELFEVCDNINIIVDILVYYLFHKRKTVFKYIFWQCFGDIVFKNIEKNIQHDCIYCNKCGKRFYREHFNEHLCNNCRKYKKMNDKIIVCIDCGKSFTILPKNTTSSRCKDCYSIYRKNNIKDATKNYKKFSKS